MEPNQGRMVSMTLEVMSFSLGQDGETSFFCTHCDKLVEIHQPDSGLPDRMLGTCDQCHVWYLLTRVSGENRAVIIELPDISPSDPNRNGIWPMTNGRQS